MGPEWGSPFKRYGDRRLKGMGPEWGSPFKRYGDRRLKGMGPEWGSSFKKSGSRMGFCTNHGYDEKFLRCGVLQILEVVMAKAFGVQHRKHQGARRYAGVVADFGGPVLVDAVEANTRHISKVSRYEFCGG